MLKRVSLCWFPELAIALAASLAESEELEGVRPGAAPPASKHAVKALVREKLTEERLKQLGGADAQCSVCRRVPVLSPACAGNVQL